MQNTKIEWAHDTLNWWWGCAKVSPACEHCYAEMMCKLFGQGRAVWGATGKRWIRENAVRDAHKILRLAETGERRRVFVNSMSDTFEEHPGLTEARIDALGFMAAYSAVNWLLLTKRPENVRRMVPTAWLDDWPAHVWIGTTVEDQKRADERIPVLLSIPAKVRFLSCEPLLGPVTINSIGGDVLESELNEGVDWIICGGESGAGARPMHLDWARSLRDQCQAGGVPFFFKQWGEWIPEDDDGPMVRVGKKAAGRQLDLVEWNEVPS